VANAVDRGRPLTARLLLMLMLMLLVFRPESSIRKYIAISAKKSFATNTFETTQSQDARYPVTRQQQQ
jgi:hypothetical protein